MPVFSRILVLFALLAVSAGAADIQVIEGDTDGTWDLSAKKLRAMATVYLAELGHVSSSVLGVSFSASGPAKRVIQMKKFLPYGLIEEDSLAIANMDVADDAVKAMLTKSFGNASRIYKSENPSEVFFMDAEFVDVDDSTANLANESVEKALGELGYRLVEDGHRETSLQMFLVKLNDSYWLGMVRVEGSYVVRGAHKKFMLGEDLESVILLLTKEVMDLDVRPSDPDAEVRDYGDTHEAKCRAANDAESIPGSFAGFTADILCELSDYLGIEVAVGGKNLYDDLYPDVRFGFTWGFSDNHAWIVGLDYAGTMGQTKSRWAFESAHRFSQAKGVFVDFIWGWGVDDVYDGWYIGGDIGYNLIAIGARAHWLSVMLRYDWGLDDDWVEGGRISVNLVYNLRGYFSD